MLTNIHSSLTFIAISSVDIYSEERNEYNNIMNTKQGITKLTCA